MYKNLLNFAARFLKQRTITHKDNENRFSIFNHFTGGIHPTRMDLHKNTAGSCSSSSFNSTLPMGRLKSSQWHCSCLYHLHDDCNSPMVNVYGSTVCFRGNSADVGKTRLMLAIIKLQQMNQRHRSLFFFWRQYLSITSQRVLIPLVKQKPLKR